MRTPSRGSSASSPRFARTHGRPQLPLLKAVKGAPTDQGGCPLRQRSNTILLALAAGAAGSPVVAGRGPGGDNVGVPGQGAPPPPPPRGPNQRPPGEKRARARRG